MEAERLKAGAVAYLNVDSSASGNRFQAAAVPALAGFLREVARAVPDPRGGSVYDNWLAQSDPPSKEAPVTTRLGSGSDYTVFLNFLGIPVADLTFDGPYGVYHSVYDSFTWMDRVGDPGYLYHATLARYWAVAGLRLAECDVAPLDYAAYAREVETYLTEVGDAAAARSLDLDLAPARLAAERWEKAARALDEARGRALAEGNEASMARIHAALLKVERALLDPAGLAGRPWFKHLVYAPRPTYKALVLPGLAEAVEAKDPARARSEAARLSRALDRAASVLEIE
jgi:N-acetylated-alpha-linked acidic dipeptidase